MNAETRDPYLTGEAPRRWDRPHSAPQARLVAVLRETREDPGLKLIPNRSRAVRAGEINEIVATGGSGAAAGGEVGLLACLGFAEFTRGGMLIEGDHVVVGGETIGEIAGFDETRMPNHRTIVLRNAGLVSGLDRGFGLSAGVSFISQYTED